VYTKHRTKTNGKKNKNKTKQKQKTKRIKQTNKQTKAPHNKGSLQCEQHGPHKKPGVNPSVRKE